MLMLYSGSAQARSPSAQVKAAAAQVRRLILNQGAWDSSSFFVVIVPVSNGACEVGGFASVKQC